MPIIVAQIFFIGAVGIAIFRTASAAGASVSSDIVFINVEAHSIAFSALYFWIIPVVILSSIIGVSQTEAAIPRILRRFQIDVDRLGLENGLQLPNDCLDDGQQRIFYGGIYSWQPQTSHESKKWWTTINVIPYLVVIMGTVTGVAISALVPPSGWNCRHNGEILILFAWLLSAQIDTWVGQLWPLNGNNKVESHERSQRKNQDKLFWSMVIKDFLATIATMGGIIATQVGIFNKCECYTLWGRTGLALPEMPDVAQTLFYRLHLAYPAIAFSCIGIQLILVPLYICIRYRDAVRTFVQRDDRKSNAKWLWNLLKKCRAYGAVIQPTLPRTYFRLSKGDRTGTVMVEEGSQHLTHTWSEEPEDIATGGDIVAETSAADDQSNSMDSRSRSRGVDSLDMRRRIPERTSATM